MSATGNGSTHERAMPRVLVVDDDPAILLTIEALLSPTAYVRSCSSGEMALKFIETWMVDVVCADYGLPGMTGLELLRKVATLDGPTRGLLITGNDDFRNATEWDGFYVLLKPFNPQRLLATVHHLAQLAAMRRTIDSNRAMGLPGVVSTSGIHRRASPLAGEHSRESSGESSMQTLRTGTAENVGFGISLSERRRRW